MRAAIFIPAMARGVNSVLGVISSRTLLILPTTTVRSYHLSTARNAIRKQAFPDISTNRRIPVDYHPVLRHTAKIVGLRKYSSDSSKPGDVAENTEQFGLVDPDIIRLQYEHEEVALIFRLFQTALESLHDGSLLGCAVPWWGVIAGSVVFLRLGVAFPAFVYQQRGLAKVRKFNKVITAWTKTIAYSVKREHVGAPLPEMEFRKLVKRRAMNKKQELLVQYGCHPMLYILVSILQLPIWVSMTFSLRRLSQGVWWASSATAIGFPSAPGMSTEGLLWFKDLSVADPTYILPVCTGVVYMVNTILVHQWHKRISKENSLTDSRGAFTGRPWYHKLLTGFTFVMPFIIACFATKLPAAIPFYWVLSASFTTMQYALRLNSRTRRFITKS
ncbi:hypothetical protein EV178_005943 [Coemansia sp. RSA 1646]|nr:hypothetical protein EV178_005943 [Coemansia sp. RSA 1646]